MNIFDIHICTILLYFLLRKTAVCLVMQYMGGGSLQNLIDAKYPVEETAVAVVAYSVLRALEELHSRNIIHRDVKVL